MKILLTCMLTAAICCVLPTPADAAGPAQLIADIAPGSANSDGDPSQFYQMNGTVFYRGYHPDSGYELWRTNGTAAGTWLVKDILSGPGESEPRNLVAHGGYLYFLADNGSFNSELWRSDGSPGGTIQLLKGHPYAEILNFYVTASGQLYLEGVNEDFDYALMVSDGSLSGTTVLHQGDGPAYELHTKFFGEIGSNTLFSSGGGTQLWVTDGTDDGTHILKDMAAGGINTQFYGHAQLGDKLYFALLNGVWCTDGTEAGTVLVKSLTMSTNGRSQLQKVGDTLYFSAGETYADKRLWKTDGTSAGTVMVSTDSGASPYFLTATDNLVYYIATNASNSPELWRSDGTAAGTVQLTNFNTPGDTVPGELTAVGSRLFFRSYDNGDLYVSDGTVAGTTLVKEFEKVVSDSYDGWPTAAFGTSAIFTAEGGTGRDLWISDGTADGTRLVHEPLDAPESSPGSMLNVGSKWFFHADDGAHGREPWVSDGTPQGTFLLKDIRPGAGGSMYEIWNFTAMNGKTYFAADDGIHGIELWATDGTETGTHIVAEIGSGVSDGVIAYDFVSSEGKLFFVARKEDSGVAMWVTDGTAAGTKLIRDVLPSVHGMVTPLTAMNGEMYYVCTHYPDGSSTPSYDTLWKTDGTFDGTELLTYFDHMLYSVAGQEPAVANDILFFPKRTSVYGAEVWTTDGTADGTRLLKDISPGELNSLPQYLTAVDDHVYFSADGRLWKSDGTETGTLLVKNGYTQSLADNHGQLMFGIGYTAEKGLWQSDGTEPGTIMIHAAPPDNLKVIGTDAIYAADDGIHGSELWFSQGLDGRTEMIQDIHPIMASQPESITPGAGRVLFTANDGVHGRELWGLDIGDIWPTAATGWELYE